MRFWYILESNIWSVWWILKMKNKSVATFIHIKQSLLSDIWWVRNPKKKHTFRQQHVTGFIQRRLIFFLVSNALQGFINKMDILTALFRI